MYRLTEEQSGLLDRVRRVANDVIGPNAADVDANARFPKESIAALGGEGLLGLTVPVEYGGLGQGPRVACAALDTIAQHCASTAMVYLMHLCGCACYAARPEAAGDALREAAAGRHLSTLAWSEKGSRSHFWAPVSQAVQNDGQAVLNAEKSWVTSAGQADGYVVSTQTAGAETPTDTILYLVPKGAPGLEAGGPWNGLGLRGNASAPMTLKDCVIPAGRALSEPHDGFRTMLEVVLPWFNLGNAAVSVGIAEAATAATTSHLANTRFEEEGSRLSDLPTLRARLAQMRIATDRARAHLISALDALEEPGPITMLFVLESKASAGVVAKEVVEMAMQACGGAAFSRHLSVERNFRDAHAASVMAPTTDVLYDFIGKALCGMPLF